jgi:hypothetical protein
VPIAHLPKIFHVPAVLTFTRTFAMQHHLALLFLVAGIVQRTWIAGDFF